MDPYFEGYRFGSHGWNARKSSEFNSHEEWDRWMDGWYAGQEE